MKKGLKEHLPEQMNYVMQEYYEKLLMHSISDKLLRKLNKISREIVREVIDSYDFRQHIFTRLDGKDNKIIITTVLTKKSPIDKG